MNLKKFINDLSEREKWAYGLISSGVVVCLAVMSLAFLSYGEIFQRGEMFGALLVLAGIIKYLTRDRQ